MDRGHLVERQDRAAVNLVAPAVDDRRHAVHPEGCRHVTGDGVGVEEQHPLALRDERGSEVRGDHRLADAALRVEHDHGLAAAAPVGLVDLALEDRTGAVVDGGRADAHRLDPPADRFGGVGADDVLVVGMPRRGLVERVERARVDHEQGRDRPAALVERGPGVLAVEVVGLGIDHGDDDVLARGQQVGELAGAADVDRIEPAGMELEADRVGLRVREQDRDGGA